MKLIDKVSSIKKNMPDDFFITCVSFEERCLGAIRKFNNYLSDKVIIFKFEEENQVRERRFLEMEGLLTEKQLKDKCQKIVVKHGMTTDGILQLHNYCKDSNLFSSYRSPSVTIDITTFTKELLFEVLFYLKNILKIKNLRFLYTIPQKYAAPDEGPLSYGIKNMKVIPFFWNNWSATKDDLLIVVLGYEEMRAWSLISRFDSDVNMLFITKPGSRPGWDTHCAIFNKRLLKENYSTFEMPAIDPFATVQILEKLISKGRLYEKYNIFIAPLGTKPQIIGIFYFLNKHPQANINIISTTAIEHNIPYYSWGIGETYYIFSDEIT